MASLPDTPATLLARIAVQATGQTDEAAWLRFFELYAPAIRLQDRPEGPSHIDSIPPHLSLPRGEESICLSPVTFLCPSPLSALLSNHKSHSKYIKHGNSGQCSQK